MNKHSEIQHQFYDYATNALNDNDRHIVEQHLSSCKSCAETLKELQSTLALLPHPTTSPSDEKDEAFWTHLAMNVEKEIRQKNQPRSSKFFELVENIRSFFTLRPTYGYALGGAIATIALAFLLSRFIPQQKPELADTQPTVTEPAISPALYKQQERVSQYFRTSRTLLVGLANIQTDDENNLDLSTEKNKARSLIREARFVKMQPINNRTERLVNDLERILIELANLEEENDLPNVELIRSGIKQENLLFKIRMAEASFDTSRISRERIY